MGTRVGRATRTRGDKSKDSGDIGKYMNSSTETSTSADMTALLQKLDFQASEINEVKQQNISVREV